ncbi:MAG TPA: hypothetical protein VN420_00520 [Candidatus Fimivivens sp.]|nr:hypothetical protein [Candidatus Fimivivens sp.]
MLTILICDPHKNVRKELLSNIRNLFATHRLPTDGATTVELDTVPNVTGNTIHLFGYTEIDQEVRSMVSEMSRRTRVPVSAIPSESFSIWLGPDGYEWTGYLSVYGTTETDIDQIVGNLKGKIGNPGTTFDVEKHLIDPNEKDTRCPSIIVFSDGDFPNDLEAAFEETSLGPGVTVSFRKILGILTCLDMK